MEKFVERESVLKLEDEDEDDLVIDEEVCIECGLCNKDGLASYIDKCPVNAIVPPQ